MDYNLVPIIFWLIFALFLLAHFMGLRTKPKQLSRPLAKGWRILFDNSWQTELSSDESKQFLRYRRYLRVECVLLIGIVVMLIVKRNWS